MKPITLLFIVLLFAVGCGDSTASRLASKTLAIGDTVRVGDLDVTLVSVSIGPAPIVKPKDEPRKEHGFIQTVVRLSLKNITDTKRVKYASFGAKSDDSLDARERCTLRDEYDNEYRGSVLSSLPINILEGESGNATINPGETHGDILLFEPPIAKATNLTLHLPGGATFRIPVEKIDRK